MIWPTRYRPHALVRLAIWPLLIAFSISTTGCAARIQSTLASSLIEDVSTAAARHDDPALIAAGLPTFLLMLEGLLEDNPRDKKMLLSAAEAYTTYAALIESDDPKRALRLYKRAKEYGTRALTPEQAALLRVPYPELAAAIGIFKPSDIAAVFWTASSWGAWISANTASLAALADLPKVIDLMHWVIAQDETYHNGSAHLFLGVYHAALPPQLGGKPDLANHHFDRALAISQGRQLIFYVLKAKFYARQTFDRPLFENLLSQVLDSPPDAHPDFTLQNIAAQKQAQILLGQVDEYF